MTIPYLMNCGHSSYGICEKCSFEYPPPDGWFSAGLPPANCRKVVMRFDNDSSRDCEGFHWAPEGAWYKSERSKVRRNSVHPVQWKEKAFFSDDELKKTLDGLYAYDTGCIDSGIKDENLRAKAIEAIHKDIGENRLFTSRMARIAREMFLSDKAIEQGYGLEDMREFINWLDERMRP